MSKTPSVQVKQQDPAILVVGTMMKESRQRSLCSSGLLHGTPRQGVCYIPLLPSLPLSQQARVNALLVKASDFLDDVHHAAPTYLPQFAEVRLCITPGSETTTLKVLPVQETEHL